MMEIRLIAADLDGTLLNEAGEVSELTQRVIHCDPNTSLYFRNVRLPAIRYQISKGHSTADIRV